MARPCPCVALVVAVNAPAPCSLLPPPEGSGRWTQKLWSCLKPMGDQWVAILQGSLAEVSSHLWHHQALFFQMGDDHVCVHFSELLDPSAEDSKRMVREVELDEESGRRGAMTIKLQMIDLLETPEAEDLDLSQLVMPSEVFSLTLRLPEGALGEAEMLRNPAQPHSLLLRFDSVETSMELSRSTGNLVSYQFPLVDSWEDLPEALSDLQVYLQIDEAGHETPCDLEIPVDLSNLIDVVKQGEGHVSVEVRSAAADGLDPGLTFLANICRINRAEPSAAPGLQCKEMDVWDRGARLLSVGPRHWRLSIDIRSVRLTERGANVFVSYNYPVLHQPRPFRTNPPHLMRKKATMGMPHAFAAYNLKCEFEDLQAGLEEALYLEVWHRDLYRKDSVVGIAEVNLSHLSSQPLQSSPSQSSGDRFRALDQVCPIISEDESQVGAVRVVVFLEDLGLIPGSKVDVSDSSGRKPEKVPQLGPAMAAVKPQQAKGCLSSEAPLKGAYELEMWRQAEEEKFRIYLLEQEQGLQDRLTEEFRQKEELRAVEFAQRKTKLQDLETAVRFKLQELQERELAVLAEETKVATLQEETQRRMGMAISQHEDATRREAKESEHRLELSRQRSQFLEEQCQNLEAKLQVHLSKLSALQQQQVEQRRHEAPVAAPDMNEELHSLRLQLREQGLRNEAIAASRDHFRRKVEDLCARLSGPSMEAPQLVSASVAPQGPDLATALRQVQDNLAKLADSWTETPKRSPSETRAQTPRSSQKVAPPQRVGAQDPARMEEHLASDFRKDDCYYVQWYPAGLASQSAT